MWAYGGAAASSATFRHRGHCTTNAAGECTVSFLRSRLSIDGQVAPAVHSAPMERHVPLLQEIMQATGPMLAYSSLMSSPPSEYVAEGMRAVQQVRPLVALDTASSASSRKRASTGREIQAVAEWERKVPAVIIIKEHFAKREIQQNGNLESTLNNIVRSYNLPLQPGDPPWENLYQRCSETMQNLVDERISMVYRLEKVANASLNLYDLMAFEEGLFETVSYTCFYTGVYRKYTFKRENRPLENRASRAMIYCAAPDGKQAKDEDDFLGAVRETGTNIFRAVILYNERPDQHQPLDCVRMCLVSGGIFLYPDTSKVDVATALISGISAGWREAYNDGQHEKKCKTVFEFAYDENVFATAYKQLTMPAT